MILIRQIERRFLFDIVVSCVYIGLDDLQLAFDIIQLLLKFLTQPLRAGIVLMLFSLVKHYTTLILIVIAHYVVYLLY